MNRSKLLPIHQFPNLIDEVARLKELASNDAPGAFARYMCEELHASPDMLAVLSGFQEGDAYALDQIRLWLDDQRLTSTDPGECDYETITNSLKILQRYIGMAQAMEAAR